VLALAASTRKDGHVKRKGDAEGHRVGVSELIGVAFNASGDGFLDAARYQAMMIFDDEAKTNHLTARLAGGGFTIRGEENAEASERNCTALAAGHHSWL
jgi:hypothetical protein